MGLDREITHETIKHYVEQQWEDDVLWEEVEL